MTQYTKAIKTAKKLIAKFGQSGFVRTYTDVGAGPSQPWKPTGSTHTDIACKMVIIDFRPDQVEGYAYQRGDKLCYIDAATLNGHVIVEEDILIDSAGTEWAIISPARVYPSHEDILFQMYVRTWPRRSK